MLLLLFGLQSQTDLASGACPPTPTRNPCHLSWVTNLARQAQPGSHSCRILASGNPRASRPITGPGLSFLLFNTMGPLRSQNTALIVEKVGHPPQQNPRQYSLTSYGKFSEPILPIPTQPHCLPSHFDFSASPPHIASTHATPLLAHPVQSIRNFLIHSANTPRANELPSPGQTWFLSSAMAKFIPMSLFLHVLA